MALYRPDLWWKKSQEDFVERTAGALLGVSEDDHMLLFVPWGSGGPTAIEITREMAARVLEHFALTGEVKWAKRFT